MQAAAGDQHLHVYEATSRKVEDIFFFLPIWSFVSLPGYRDPKLQEGGIYSYVSNWRENIFISWC